MIAEGITIFGNHIKTIIIFTAAEAGGVDIAEIDIEAIVPALFIFFIKGEEVEGSRNGQRKIITTSCPVTQCALSGIDGKNATAFPTPAAGISHLFFDRAGGF